MLFQKAPFLFAGITVMSFALDLKKELASKEPEKACCQLAEISGFLRSSSSAILDKSGHFGFKAVTGEPSVARHYKKLIKEYFSLNPELKIQETNRFGKTRKYVLTLSSEEGGEQVLRETGILMIRKGRNYITDGIMDSLIRTKCCRKSYLKGAFLGAGAVSDPKKGYHMEFKCGSKGFANDMKKLIETFYGLSCGISERRGKYVVYMKKASNIGDTFVLMGGDKFKLELENTMLEKHYSGKAARITNFDDANSDRAIDAAGKQVEAIKALKRSGKYDSMPAKLKEIAELRLKNPELTIKQLGEKLDPPLKKSGVNNRLKRIMELARN